MARANKKNVIPLEDFHLQHILLGFNLVKQHEVPQCCKVKVKILI